MADSDRLQQRYQDGVVDGMSRGANYLASITVHESQVDAIKMCIDLLRALALRTTKEAINNPVLDAYMCPGCCRPYTGAISSVLLPKTCSACHTEWKSDGDGGCGNCGAGHK